MNARGSAMNTSTHRCFTLLELLVVVGLLAIAVAVLPPSLSRARNSAAQARLAASKQYGVAAEMALQNLKAADGAAPADRPLARVKDFRADLAPPPRLRMGTAGPESIYEALFKAPPQAAQGEGQ